MNNVKDIGELNGRVLLFGGVYSNLEALSAIQDIARQENIDASNIINTGDIVGYCADPDVCLQEVKNWGIHNIAGNVELNLKDGEVDCGCNFDEGSRCDTFSKQWYPFAQSKVSPDSMQFIEQIPEFLQFRYAGKSCLVLHGGLEDTSQFIFKSTPTEIKQEIFEKTNVDVIIAGHAGIPFCQHIGSHFWFNPGVIGMPANDGTPQVWYAMLDDRSNFECSILSLNYDYHSASQKMNDNPLPHSYAKTLKTGIWDNVEILPEAERALQGISIVPQKHQLSKSQ